MVKIALLSASPLGYPASCWISGCACEWLCGGAGATGCTGIAVLAAAALFAGLAFCHALAGLDAFRD